MPTQGPQTPLTPREQYRRGLAALAAYCRASFAGRTFDQLSPPEQDHLLTDLEKGDVTLPGFEAKTLFAAVHTNTMEGFFADPIYGGNRDMLGWRLIGFPGTRYDYRDVMDKPQPALHAAAGRDRGAPGLGWREMTTRLPRKDVVIVGLGWTGSILALELARSGLDVVAIEHGPWRDTATDFNIGTAADELRFGVRHELFLRPAQETLTMRNRPDQTALPIRRWGSFIPGNGVGGAGVHWNGQTWRFQPNDFTIRSDVIARYGEGALPAGNQIQDWGVTYDELEPHYDAFEYVCGISGLAGNLKGVIQPRATLSRGLAAGHTLRRRSSRATRRSCSRRRRVSAVCIRSRVPPPTSPRPSPIRTAVASPLARSAASASASVAQTTRNRARRPACSRS